jgi:hypothetical protein
MFFALRQSFSGEKADVVTMLCATTLTRRGSSVVMQVKEVGPGAWPQQIREKLIETARRRTWNYNPTKTLRKREIGWRTFQWARPATCFSS